MTVTMTETAPSVFLVDDHAILRQGLRRILEESGCRVIGEAGNGIQAREALSSLNPRVIILDISLPGVRGIELAGEFRESHPESRIIFLTVHKEAEYVTQALSAGASGYVLKDCLDTEIIDAIHCVTRGKTYLTPMISSEIIHSYPRTTGGTYGPFHALSLREREVLSLLCEGETSKEIAGKLLISVRTVEHHRQSIMRKLGAGSVPELMKLAIRHRFIEIE